MRMRSGLGAVCAVVLVGVAGCSPGGSLDVPTIERGCANVGACISMGAMRDCVSRFRDAYYRDELLCVAGANGSCEAAYACFGATVYPDLTCTTTTSSCEGSTRVVCTDGFVGPSYTARIDCTAEGTTCVADGSGNTFCAIGTCSASGRRCLGEHVAACSGSFELLERCPSGSACDPEFSRCVPTGPACTTGRCEGDVVVSCDEGREFRQDCGTLGLACVVTGGSPSCEATGTECNSTFAERCVGSELEYCGANDTIERFDCSAHGFSGCGGSPARCTVAGFSPLG